MADYVRVPLADWQAICTAVRAKTGGVDELLSGEVAPAINGVESGGGGIQIGENTTTPNLLNLFYALENGTAVTGEFTLATTLPNTETLIFDSGLAEIKGIFYVDCDYAYTATSGQPEYGVWGLYMVNPDGLGPVQCMGLSTWNTTGKYYDVKPTDFVDRVATTTDGARVDGGALYVTAAYNQHATYTPFMSGHRYKWVAW